MSWHLSSCHDEITKAVSLSKMRMKPHTEGKSNTYRCTKVIALGIAIAMFYGTGCKPASKNSPPPPMVEVATVAQGEPSIYNEWVGALDGLVNAQIRAQVSGYIISQDYDEGQIVKKGDLLFEIDPRPFQAALDQVKGLL